jgi:Caspase domain
MSKLTQIFLGFLLLLTTANAYSQSFYEIKFQDASKNEYTGFWVYKSESENYMRIAYYNTNGDYRVVNVDYKAETGKTESGVNYFILSGSNPKYITAAGDGESYGADYFFWTRYDDEEYGLPMVTEDPDFGEDSFREVETYTELNPRDFDKEYLNQFYATDEADYLALMSMVENNASLSDNAQYGDSYSSGGSGGDSGNSGNSGQHGDSWTGGDSGNSGNSGDSGSSGDSGQHGDSWTGGDSGNSGNSGDHGGNNDLTITTSGNNGNSGSTGDGGAGNNGLTSTNIGINNNSNGNGSGHTDDSANHSGRVTFHLVVAANTEIGDIGTSCLVDERNLVNEFEGICEVMGITLKKYMVDGKNFTKPKLLSTLNGLNPGKNDIVFFAYTGHGFRWSNQTEKYPQLDMRYNPYTSITTESSITLKEVYDIITSKSARLNIVLGDCCNSDVGVNQRTSNTFLSARNDANFNRKNLEKLFYNSDGDVIATAASPGQVSWSNSVNGGFFLSSFFQAFREEIGYLDTDPSWSGMLSNTIKYAAYKSSKAACSNCTEQNGQKSVSVTY